MSAFALLAVSGSSAKAQSPMGPPPGPVMPAVYGEMMPGGYGGHMGVGMHGGLPGAGLPGTGLFKGLFQNHGSHKRRRLFGADPEKAQMLPVATGGTLVFPQNPFVRSPRDFFMYDR